MGQVAEGADGQLHMGPPRRPRPSRAPSSDESHQGRERRTAEREVLDAKRDRLEQGPASVTMGVNAIAPTPLTRPCGYRNGPLTGGSRGRRETGSPAFFLVQ